MTAPTNIDTIERDLLRQTPKPQNHHTPTRHTPEDGFALFPHPRGVPLANLSRTYTYEQARATVACVPFFTQLDPMIFWTDRAHHIPHAAAAMHQMPVCVELIRQLSPQLVVSTLPLARTIETALAENNVTHPFAWHLLCSPTEARDMTTTRRIYIDLHTLPGIGSAYQCPTIAGSDLFHLAPEFSWRFDADTLYATHSEPESHPCPLSNFPLHHHVSLSKETCPCAQTIYTIPTTA